MLLRVLQRGERLGMPASRPMPAVGPRCHELRVNDDRDSWRLIYRIDADAIVLLAVFSKKTPPHALADHRCMPRKTSPLRRPMTTTPDVMPEAKRRRLESRGWQIGSAQEFLGLTDEEAAMIEIRVRLAQALREVRRSRRWTQAQVAARLGSSQSRVAKMEAADQSVSLDLLVRSLCAVGASGRDIGAAFAAVDGTPGARRSRRP